MKSEAEILSRIKQTVLEREPSAKIYLYGSRAKRVGAMMSLKNFWSVEIREPNYND
jgi:hypothetical protein